MRGANHRDVITEPGSVFGEVQGLDRGFDSRTCDQQFIRRCGGTGGLQHSTALFIRQKNGFAGRSKHHQAGDRRLRIALNIVLELLVIDTAVGIKGRTDRRKDAMQQHKGSHDYFKLTVSVLAA